MPAIRTMVGSVNVPLTRRSPYTLFLERIIEAKITVARPTPKTRKLTTKSANLLKQPILVSAFVHEDALGRNKGEKCGSERGCAAQQVDECALGPEGGALAQS